MSRSPSPEVSTGAADQMVKTGHASNFDRLNDQLAQTPFDRHVRFFNFGYVPLAGDPVAGPKLGARFPNRESAQLLFEVIGDVDLTDAVVAEVGSGRGGNLWLVEQHYAPRYVVGLDIAWKSVQFAMRGQDGQQGAFLHGDAERLPFRDACLDAILNVETSCTYPDIEAFYREVARTLRPGGWFLYTDLIESSMCTAVVDALEELGLEAVVRRDISANVLASRDQRAGRQVLAFGDTGTSTGWEEYVGLAGTRLHHYLQSGQKSYLILQLRRSADVGAPSATRIFTAEQRELLRAVVQDGVEIMTIGPGHS